MAEAADDRRRTRRGRWGVALLLVATVGAAAVPGLLGKDGDWRRVERRDLVIGVPLEGELRAVDSAPLAPPQIRDLWRFKIASMVPEGTEVVAGEAVVSFDPSELEQALRREIAERDAAQKELEKKAIDHGLERRDLELSLAEARARARKASFLLEVPDDVVAHNELAEARIDRRLAGLEIAHLEASLESLARREELEIGTLTGRRDLAASRVDEMRRAIDRLTVRAPRAGTVIYEADWRGDKPKLGEQVWKGRRLGGIPDLSRMEAEGEVAEADAGRIAVGQPVTFRLDAYPDREYGGRVQRIRRAVERRSAADPSKVMEVVLAIEGSDRKRLRPGMRLRGRIETERHADVLAVPEEAVFIGPGGAWVVVRAFLGERRVSPELGVRGEGWFRVLAGLEEGDAVRVPERGEEGR